MSPGASADQKMLSETKREQGRVDLADDGAAFERQRAAAARAVEGA